MEDISSYKLAGIIARITDNMKAEDISILNIRNVSVLADYFVICSAGSTTQVKSLTSRVREKIKELLGRIPTGEETDSKSRWNLLDYGDVVVHVLHKEERETYAIEKFWNHACKVEMDDWLAESEELKDQLL